MPQPRIRKLFDRYYPAYRSEETIFRAHLAVAAEGARCVLDAGCGSGELCSHDLRAEGRIVIGVDVDRGLANNRWVTAAVRGKLDALPFPDDSADLVVARYVLEHVENPAVVFRELARVLRPGGHFVLLTPNASHYVALISRWTPTWVHRRVKAGHSVAAEDVFPTHYRANTRRTLAALAREAGFTVSRFDAYETSPNYLEFSRLLYRVGVLYERVVNRFSILAGLRVSLVATLTKRVEG